jgi:hypothetical protein
MDRHLVTGLAEAVDGVAGQAAGYKDLWHGG